MTGGGEALRSVPIDEGSGPTVVLVHGQPGSGAGWRRLADELSADHRVLAPDRPGWGGNPRPAGGLSANAVALARLVGHCGATTPVSVVGHSLGGGVAIELALSHPDLVASLVLLGSVGVASSVTNVDRLLAMPMVGDGIVLAGSSAVQRGIAAAARLPRSSRVRTVAGRLAGLPGVRTVVEWGSEPVTGRARASFLVEQRALLDETPSLERRLPLLRIPVAVVNGASDHIVPAQSARRLADAIPGAEFILLRGEGHFVAAERPDLVAPIVRRYVALGKAAPGSDRA